MHGEMPLPAAPASGFFFPRQCCPLYYVLEGEMPLQMGDRVYPLRAGDCMAVPAHTLHAVGGSLPFKLLQITLQ